MKRRRSSVIPNQRNQILTVTFDVTISCPMRDLHWLKDNKVVKNGPKFLVHNEENGRRYMLIMKNVKLSDHGVFSLRVASS